MTTRPIALTAGLLLALAAPLHAQQGPSQAELNRAAGSTDWLLPNHDYSGVRFVDLDQINTGNAAALRPVCMFQGVDTARSQSNPLVYRGTLYLTTLWSTVALDAATCRVKWRHEWKPQKRGESRHNESSQNHEIRPG